MRHYVTIFLKRLAVVLEFVISIMLAIGIVLLRLSGYFFTASPPGCLA